MSKRGKIVVIAGPSGVGKKSIWGDVIFAPKYNISMSISMTTRSSRPNEYEGIDYFFVSKQQFEHNIKNNMMLEWAQFSGNYYGTPRAYVEKLLAKGVNVFLEIEIEGVKQIIKAFENEKDSLLTIFISPPSIEDLRKRLLNRKTETSEEVESRIAIASSEIAQSNIFQYVIVNSDLDESKHYLIDILNENL